MILCCLLTCLPITTTVKAANKKLIAITFDDGPSGVTARLLDGLKERGAKATFFMLGSCANNYPNTVRRVYEEGHQICSHSYDHPQLTAKDNDQVYWQMNKTRGILNSILDMDFQYHIRPPYGDVNSRVLSVFANSFSAASIIWSIDPLDWQDRNAQTVANRVVSGAYDGAIVLCHDIYGTTVTGILSAIDTLASYGYEFVTLNELYRRRGLSLTPGQNHYSCKGNGTDLGAISAPVLTEADATGGKQVTMTAQDGAKIYYTTDGSNPIYSKQVYTKPITVTPGATVRAVAAYHLNGSRSKETKIKTTEVLLTPPTLTVRDGKLYVDNPNEGTDIRYTTSGSPVTESSAIYNGPISLYDGTFRYRIMGQGVSSGETVLYITKNGNLFRDVHTEAWYAQAADRAQKEGLIQGMGDYCFGPEEKLTRGMFVTILYRLMEKLGEDMRYSAKVTFPDLSQEWYMDAVAWAAANEIVSGYTDGTFKPEKPVSREEMCVILSRALTWYGMELTAEEVSYTDKNMIALWSLPYVNEVSAIGILSGYTDGSFRPQATATRAQAATVLLRTFDLCKQG